MRALILDKARELMIEKGIRETSLKNIASAAGISAGTLYYYYSAKEDIIYDLAESNMEQITEGLVRWVKKAETDVSPMQILKEVFEIILSDNNRGKFHLYLISGAELKNSSLSEKFKKQYDDWRAALKIELGKLFTGTNEALPYMILALLDGLIIQKNFGAENLPVEQMLSILFKV